MVFDKRSLVKREDLPVLFRSPSKSSGRVVVQLPEGGIRLQEVERDILLAALERHDWNQTRAAQYLGITRNTLIYRMQKYNIREPGGEKAPKP